MRLSAGLTDRSADGASSEVDDRTALSAERRKLALMTESMRAFMNSS